MTSFIIYSKPQCTFCDQAKALLDSRGIQFDIVNLDVGQPKQDGEKYISREDLLAQIPTARTMPQIMKYDHTASVHIGGYQELKTFLHV